MNMKVSRKRITKWDAFLFCINAKLELDDSEEEIVRLYGPEKGLFPEWKLVFEDVDAFESGSGSERVDEGNLNLSLLLKGVIFDTTSIHDARKIIEGLQLMEEEFRHNLEMIRDFGK